MTKRYNLQLYCPTTSKYKKRPRSSYELPNQKCTSQQCNKSSHPGLTYYSHGLTREINSAEQIRFFRVFGVKKQG